MAISSISRLQEYEILLLYRCIWHEFV